MRCCFVVRTLAVIALGASAMTLPASAATFTFQQGLNGYTGVVDTFIQTSSPDAANGGAFTFEWNTSDPAGSGQDNFALIRFNDIFGVGPGQIPTGAAITRATFTYTLTAGASVATMYEAVVDWDANTTFNTFGPGPGVQTSDYSVEKIATTIGSGTTRSLTVTASLVRWAQAPALNKGWIIRPTNSLTTGVMISSDDPASPTLRPTLTIEVNDTGAPTVVRGPFLQKASASAMTVAWRTDLATDSVVRFGPAPNDLSMTTTDPAITLDHAVTLTGLASGTIFFYEIGSSASAVAGADVDHFFTTSPNDFSAGPVVVWAIGDSGSATTSQRDVRDAMLAVNGGSPDLIISAGDIAYTNGTDGEYTDNFFTPFASILRQTPFWPSFGNHDGNNANAATQTGAYFDAFIMPTQGEAGGALSNTEAYYSFDIANAHFISLDSAESSTSPGSAQIIWLQNDLASTTAQWLIAFFHHAPYSNGTHDSNTDVLMTRMRENVMPLLEDFGIDLVVGGHSHGYERSFLIDGAYDTPVTAAGHILDAGDGDPAGDGAYRKSPGRVPHDGAVQALAGHTVSAHWIDPHPLIQFSEMQPGSCLIEIAADTLTVRNVRRDGVITDTFVIDKSPTCPADLDGDGFVGSADLAALLGSWGAAGAADLDGSGAVGSADLALLLGSWGVCAL